MPENRRPGFAATHCSAVDMSTTVLLEICVDRS